MPFINVFYSFFFFLTFRQYNAVNIPAKFRRYQAINLTCLSDLTKVANKGDQEISFQRILYWSSFFLCMWFSLVNFQEVWLLEIIDHLSLLGYNHK